MNAVTVFKIRIDSIKPHEIGFELFSGERVNDVYVNSLSKGGYGQSGRIILTPKQFTDFAQRLIAYVYTEMVYFSNEQLKILWDLKLNIFNNQAQKISNSIFTTQRERLLKLELVKGKGKNDKK